MSSCYHGAWINITTSTSLCVCDQYYEGSDCNEVTLQGFKTLHIIFIIIWVLIIVWGTRRTYILMKTIYHTRRYQSIPSANEQRATATAQAAAAAAATATATSAVIGSGGAGGAPMIIIDTTNAIAANNALASPPPPAANIANNHKATNNTTINNWSGVLNDNGGTITQLGACLWSLITCVWGIEVSASVYSRALDAPLLRVDSGIAITQVMAVFCTYRRIVLSAVMYPSSVVPYTAVLIGVQRM
jgi:hypothetical protein